MSDYKIVNGIKIRICRYECGSELVWSDDISGFPEKNGGVAHTKDRCQEVKAKHGCVAVTAATDVVPSGATDKQYTLESVLRKLETHGIIVNVQRLMAQ